MKRKQLQDKVQELENHKQAYQHFYSNLELLKNVQFCLQETPANNNHQAWCCINNVFNLLPQTSQIKLMETLQLRIMVFSNIEKSVIDQLWRTANTCDEYLCDFKYKPFKLCRHKIDKVRSWFRAVPLQLQTSLNQNNEESADEGVDEEQAMIVDA